MVKPNQQSAQQQPEHQQAQHAQPAPDQLAQPAILQQPVEPELLKNIFNFFLEREAQHEEARARREEARDALQARREEARDAQFFKCMHSLLSTTTQMVELLGELVTPSSAIKRPRLSAGLLAVESPNFATAEPIPSAAIETAGPPMPVEPDEHDDFEDAGNSVDPSTNRADPTDTTDPDLTVEAVDSAVIVDPPADVDGVTQKKRNRPTPAELALWNSLSPELRQRCAAPDGDFVETIPGIPFSLLMSRVWVWKHQTRHGSVESKRFTVTLTCAGVLECPNCAYTARPVVKPSSKVPKTLNCRGLCAKPPSNRGEPVEPVALVFKSCTCEINYYRDWSMNGIRITHRGLHAHRQPPVVRATGGELSEYDQEAAEGIRTAPQKKFGRY